MQGLSQDLETGCSKLVIVKFLRRPIFQGRKQYIEITAINMYLFIEIRHYILTQCHGNYISVEKLKCYAWNWHFNKLLPNILGCYEGCFLRVLVSTRHPDALLANTMTWDICLTIISLSTEIQPRSIAGCKVGCMEPGMLALYEPGLALYEPGLALYEPGLALYEPGLALYEPGLALYEPGLALYEHEWMNKCLKAYRHSKVI